MGLVGDTFTRDHDWTTDKANGIKVTAERHDEHDDGVATAINAALSRVRMVWISCSLSGTPRLRTRSASSVTSKS